MSITKNYIKLIINGNRIELKESKHKLDIEFKVNVFEAVLLKLKESYVKYLKSLEYKDYLMTKHWKITRDKILFKYGYKCQLCNKSKSLEVHHKTYENIGEEKDDDLIVLCHSCHSKHHKK
jgi:hypothetical protein